MRQAYASAAPDDIQMPKLTAPTVEAQAPKPKAAAPKPALRTAYTLLSDEQIAGIKERLRLSSDQEYYWPAVETALRAVALEDLRQPPRRSAPQRRAAD